MQLPLSFDQPLEPGPESPLPNPELIFVRHPRARRYVIRIAEDGRVRVTVPRWGSKREGTAFAEQQRAWIDKQLRGWRQRRAETDLARASLTPSQQAAAAAGQRAMRQRAERELPPRLLELAARYGLVVTRVSIRNQRWRWGSCNRNGHICLNWRLVTMPEWVRDYVLIHELMHLKRMDHSPKFWKLVAAACPEYEDARRWLRRASRSAS